MGLIHFFIYFLSILSFALGCLFIYYARQYAKSMNYAKNSGLKTVFALLIVLSEINSALDIFFSQNSGFRVGTILLWTAAFLIIAYETTNATTAIRKIYQRSYLTIILSAPGSIYSLTGIAVFLMFLIWIYIFKISGSGTGSFSWQVVLSYTFLITGLAFFILGVKKATRDKYSLSQKDKRSGAVFQRDDVFITRAYASMINKFLEIAGHPLVIIEDSIAEYFENNPILFQDCRINQNGTIDFDASIKNIDRMGKENRIHHICILFSGLCSRLLELFAAITTREQAESILSDSYQATKNFYEHPILFLEILRSLPDGIMDEEKIALMSKEELEARVRERTRELEKARDYQDRLLQDLRISEGNLRRVITSNVDGIVIVNMKRTVLFANPASEELFGQDASKFIGQQLDIDIKANEVLDFKIEREPGEILTAEIYAVEIEWKNEPAYLAAIRDITQRVLMEEKLRRAEKMEALGTMAGGVAHDLNNILGGIVSYPDLILMDLREDDPLRADILAIQDSGQKAVEVIQDLLTLARRGVSVNDIVSLNDILQNYLKSPEFQKMQIYHLNINLITHLQPDLLYIIGSKTHLSKTIMNLVSNAAEAMPEGGDLIIETENQYIDRPISNYDEVKEGDYVTLKISDTGVGISPEDISKIFEPFYTKKKMGRSGTGLGMAVVWGTVKDHQGYIDVKSNMDKGTIFTLYFPATRRKPAEKEIKTPFENYLASGESILVVDDVKEQRDIACKILSELGYAVKSVKSGEEAVEYMRLKTVDLIILDMIMDPGMDGLDTYKQIVEIRPGQKAIVTSGFAETERVKAIQQLGVVQYIKKPYTLEKLGIAVKNELQKKL